MKTKKLKLKVNDYVKIKDPDRWSRRGDDDYVDEDIFEYQLDSGGLMKKKLGKVLKVFDVNNNFSDSVFEDNDGWMWNYCAIEKIITKQEYPEYFI